MHEVWQIVLEETDRVGKVRLQAADTYLMQISEPCKPLRTGKSHVAKKVAHPFVITVDLNNLLFFLFCFFSADVLDQYSSEDFSRIILITYQYFLPDWCKVCRACIYSFERSAKR